MLIFIQNNLFLIIKECFANVETCFVAVLRKKVLTLLSIVCLECAVKVGVTNKIIIMAPEECSVNSKHVCMYACMCAPVCVHTCMPACMRVCVCTLQCVNLFVQSFVTIFSNGRIFSLFSPSK